ncbi:hypothetical protein OGAPHI_001812 [Ogataea philodendri]|uniref:Uncharacterized protein n=1 Tax=Ogataea philodendri TaxID=1378263 RepID=A0A9P8T6G3_9ASCO|nr:uncharacterized protein OGAPHI_001812 [Ogataea philodendri]KAH3668058.1 hypothetical protein OGAPHI_001812 [Ogataea philodendri]
MRVFLRRFSVSLRVASFAEKLALRPYQQECIESCLKSLKEDRRIAVSLATGGGKTVIFSHLISQIPDNPATGGSKTLILVHRKELAEQAVAVLTRTHPDYKIEVDMANTKATHEPDVDVTIASVPTLQRDSRLEKYNPGEYKAVVVDECHHGVADSYIKILKYFGCDRPHCDVALLGFSATLLRSDEKSLGLIFDKIAYSKGLADLIGEGYLSDFTWILVSAGFELSKVAVGADGDYKTDDLAKFVNTEEVNSLVLQTYQHFVRTHNLKSTLFFCVDVNHLKSLSELFRANGLNAQYVTGNSSKFDRQKLLKEFSTGELPILMNCGVFTEGTDIPNIDSVFMVRPTKSTMLLTQMVGRGLRLHGLKSRCYVVDFVDAHLSGVGGKPTLSGKIAKRDTVPLFGGRGKTQEEETPVQVEEISYMEYDTVDGFQRFFEKFKGPEEEKENVFTTLLNSKYQWVQLRADAWGIDLGNNEYFQLRIYPSETKTLDLTRTVRAGKIRFPQSSRIASANEISDLLDKLDQYMTDHPRVATKYRSTFYKGPISVKQYEFLMKSITELVLKNERIDPKKFEPLLNEHLQAMSKKEAANLIFAYTVSRSYALKAYISQRILPTRESRKSVFF